MKPYTVMAHIHSLNGEMQEVTVLEQETLFGHPIQNSYIVKYGDIKCTAIYNPLVCQYFADDKFGIIKNEGVL